RNLLARRLLYTRTGGNAVRFTTTHPRVYGVQANEEDSTGFYAYRADDRRSDHRHSGGYRHTGVSGLYDPGAGVRGLKPGWRREGCRNRILARPRRVR